MEKISINVTTLRDVVLLLCKTPTKKTLELFDDVNEVVFECELDNKCVRLVVPFDNLQQAANFNHECIVALNY